jgi:putative ABC transport system permease protein
MFAWFSQIVAVTALNLRTIKERLASSLVAVIGIAGVVSVVVAVLSIAAGLRATMAGTGSKDTVLVLRGGSDTEMVSGLSGDEARIVEDAPGLLRNAQGAVASPELFVIINLPKRRTGSDANVPLRGVGPQAFEVRNGVKIVEGRRFAPGKNELIVGRGAQASCSGLDVGKTLHVGQADWTIVGAFTAGGTVPDSEIWGDVKVLQPAYRRGNTYQSVYAKLDSPASFEKFKDALTTDPRLNVKVMRESDYYAEQSTALVTFIKALGGVIAVLMGIGAVFGALNTMYTAVSSRAREIATLRALGFKSIPVVVSVLVEAFVLSLAGGILGGALTWLAFDGYQASTLNFQSFSQVSFAFAVTPSLLVLGIAYSLVMGFFGGLMPAIRAARLPVASALRES